MPERTSYRNLSRYLMLLPAEPEISLSKVETGDRLACCARLQMVRQVQPRCRRFHETCTTERGSDGAEPRSAPEVVFEIVALPILDYRRALLPTDSDPSSRMARIAGCTAGYSPASMFGRSNSGISAPREAPAGSVGMFGYFLNVSTRSFMTLPAKATVQPPS